MTEIRSTTTLVIKYVVILPVLVTVSATAYTMMKSSIVTPAVTHIEIAPFHVKIIPSPNHQTLTTSNPSFSLFSFYTCYAKS